MHYSKLLLRYYRRFFLMAPFIAALLPLPSRVAALEFVQTPFVPIGPGAIVSDDGRVVAGWARGPLNDPQIWSQTQGQVHLGVLPGDPVGRPWDLSSDGSVVVGTNGTGGTGKAFRWTAATGRQPLGFLPGDSVSFALGTSPDGSTVVGFSRISLEASEAFLWTQSGGMIGLGVPADATESEARDVSANGSVVAVDTSNRAYLWTANAGYLDLGELPPNWTGTRAVALTDDGKTLLGVGGTSASIFNLDHPFLWRQETGIVPLPLTFGAGFLRMTPDASIVVAGKNIWDPAHGTRAVADVLANGHGFVEPFNRILDISSDAKTLLLSRDDEQLWALYLDKPLVLPVPEPGGMSLLLSACALNLFRIRNACRRALSAD